METAAQHPETTVRPKPRWLTIAWKAIVVVNIGVLLWGLMALFDPVVLTEGFETFTEGTWDDFAAREAEAARFSLAGFRLVGALNVSTAVALLATAAMAYRRAQRWTWWTILVADTLVIGGPIVYDQFVGYIGPFEMLEYVGLLTVYVALAATAGILRREPEVR